MKQATGGRCKVRLVLLALLTVQTCGERFAELQRV